MLFHRVFRAVHGLRANRCFINSISRSLKVIFFKQKVKEKDKEYSSSYREAPSSADKTILPAGAEPAKILKEKQRAVPRGHLKSARLYGREAYETFRRVFEEELR